MVSSKREIQCWKESMIGGCCWHKQQKRMFFCKVGMNEWTYAGSIRGEVMLLLLCSAVLSGGAGAVGGKSGGQKVSPESRSLM